MLPPWGWGTVFAALRIIIMIFKAVDYCKLLSDNILYKDIFLEENTRPGEKVKKRKLAISQTEKLMKRVLCSCAVQCTIIKRERESESRRETLH